MISDVMFVAETFCEGTFRENMFREGIFCGVTFRVFECVVGIN